MKKPAPGAKPGDALAPMGTRAEVKEALARFNTAPDGMPLKDTASTERLFGPGMVVEIPLGMDTITQAMVTASDEEIAWPVLVKACRALGWQMVDLESGRTFG